MESVSNSPVSPEIVRDGELDLFALFLLMRRHLLRIALFSLVTTLLMVVYTLTAKPRYSATVVFLVPVPQSSSASALLQATAGFDVLGGGLTPVYVDMLRSRAIADQLIAQFGLMKLFGVKELGLAEAGLAGSTKIVAEREGLISVTVVNGDKKLAAALANAYLVDLEQLNQHFSVGSAALQRNYFQQEMIKEKNALADAEVALRQTQESTGGFEPQMQEAADLSAADQTRAQLRARQVALGALLQGATAQNPDVIRVQAEIASLEDQLRAMKSGGGGAAVPTPSARMPGQILAYVRNQREVKFHEALFEMLAREYETAKEQEAKDFSMIQVLDAATVPERKSWPPRTTYCLFAIVAGAALGVVYTLLEALLRAILRNPDNHRRITRLLSAPTTPGASR